MSTKLVRIVLPFLFFGLAISAWCLLGSIAVSDIGAGVVNPLRAIFFQADLPTHQVLGWTLFSIAVLSFLCGLFFTLRLFWSLKHERRA